MQTKPSSGSIDPTTRALLFGGVIAGPIFTIGWLIGGLVTADYNPMRHAISSLSRGESGWMQVANFLITGLLVVGFAFGLGRALPPKATVWGPRLVGLVGIGLIGAGLFVTDPLNGYPPGTIIDSLVERTTPGILHDLFSALFFLGMPIASFVFARLFSRLGKRGLAAYSALTGIGMLVAFTVARLGFRLPLGSFDLPAFFGFLQRIVVTAGFMWLTWLAVIVLRLRTDTPAAAAA